MNSPRIVGSDPDRTHRLAGATEQGEPTRPHFHDVTDGAARRPAVPAPAGEPTIGDAAAPARLIIVRGHNAGTRFPITGAHTMIGRHRECDVVLDDATVSRQHAELRDDGERYTIVDAGSLNGTYLNRQPVDRETELTDGDEVRIGTFRLAFHTTRRR